MTPIPIHAFNPGPMTGDGNWTWLIPGRVPTLIDAGTGDPRHLDAVAKALDGTPLAQVIVTHGHIDHASGAPALKVRFPGTRFLKFPWADRDERWPVGWQPIADGGVIPAGDTELVAISTPGHSPDHICLWHPPTKDLFCADLAVKGTTVYIPSQMGGDLAEYLKSLERVLALGPERMLPAHGSVIEDPEDLLRGYLVHRREREQQILEALRSGDTTPDAMVERIYQGVKAALLPVARETILSHLIKLERDGRARRSGASWQLVNS